MTRRQQDKDYSIRMRNDMVYSTYVNKGETLQNCVVHFLDGNQQSFEFSSKWRGQVLLEKVWSSIDLVETNYFGLKFLISDNTESVWLEAGEKISKQLRHSSQYQFHMRVKFYPPDATLLRDEFTRFYVYLQLRRDISEGRISCSGDKTLLLCSYILQSELGDYDPSGEHKSGYIRRVDLLPNQIPQFEVELTKLHSQRRGLTSAEAEMEFLKHASKLEEYGGPLWPVLDVSGINMKIGPRCEGVAVFVNGKKRCIYLWSLVEKIQFKGKQFILQMKQSQPLPESNHMHICTLSSEANARQLYQETVDYHIFFRNNSALPSRSSSPSLLRSSQHPCVSGSSAPGYLTRMFSTQPHSRVNRRLFSHDTSGKSSTIIPSSRILPTTSLRNSTRFLSKTRWQCHSSQQVISVHGDDVPDCAESTSSSTKNGIHVLLLDNTSMCNTLPGKSSGHSMKDTSQSPLLSTKRNTISSSGLPHSNNLCSASARPRGGERSKFCEPGHSGSSTSSNTSLNSMDCKPSPIRSMESKTIHIYPTLSDQPRTASSSSTRNFPMDHSLLKSRSTTQLSQRTLTSSFRETRREDKSPSPVSGYTMLPLSQRNGCLGSKTGDDHQLKYGGCNSEEFNKEMETSIWIPRNSKMRGTLSSMSTRNLTTSTHLPLKANPSSRTCSPYSSSYGAWSGSMGLSTKLPGSESGRGDSLLTIRICPDEAGRFGFNVKGGADHGLPVVVSRVGPNMPADLCSPRLQEGDQVLFINGRDISTHTHEQVVQFIRSAAEKHSRELVLVIRPSASVYVRDDNGLIYHDEKDYSSISPLSIPTSGYETGSKTLSDIPHSGGPSRLLSPTKAQPSLYCSTPNLGSQMVGSGHNTCSSQVPEPPTSPSSGATGNPLKDSILALQESLSNGVAMRLFEQLYRHKDGLTTTISRRPENISKNRYKDIQPYDETRVKLRSSSSRSPTSDYINANHVNMYLTSEEPVIPYIATQGPLESTCGDFWEMVWEQQAHLIVMLTANMERDRVKCHQYWPDLNQLKQYGNYRVSCISENSLSEFQSPSRESLSSTRGYIEREFILTSMNKKPSALERDSSGSKSSDDTLSSSTRHIIQLHYHSWPDHSPPSSKEEFYHFVLHVQRLRAANMTSDFNPPVIVHCSAGIGRTGVLIAMETALRLMELNEAIVPLRLVQTMRDQRGMMVQTQSQYQFVCEAILRAYQDKFGVLPHPSRHEEPKKTINQSFRSTYRSKC